MGCRRQHPSPCDPFPGGESRGEVAEFPLPQALGQLPPPRLCHDVHPCQSQVLVRHLEKGYVNALCRQHVRRYLNQLLK